MVMYILFVIGSANRPVIINQWVLTKSEHAVPLERADNANSGIERVVLSQLVWLEQLPLFSRLQLNFSESVHRKDIEQWLQRETFLSFFRG